jgi:hypothetical protein
MEVIYDQETIYLFKSDYELEITIKHILKENPGKESE